MQPTVIRATAAKMLFVVGPFIMLMGVGVLVTMIVLWFVLDTSAVLFFLMPAALGIGSGLFLLRMARKGRLEIAADGFTWCGYIGPDRTVRWQDLHRIRPPRHHGGRNVALLQFRVGREEDLVALWVGPTDPSVVTGTLDLSSVRTQLIQAHQQFLHSTARQ